MLEKSATGVTIESPFPDAYYPAVWRWIEPFRNRILDDFSAQNVDDFVAFHELRSQLPGRTTYGVRRNGDLGGLVVIERVVPAHPTATAHLLFRKSFWGHTTTIPALTKVFTDVFDTGVQIIRSEIFADNNAMRSLARALGAREYGPLPKATIRRGEAIDILGLMLTREDFSNHAGRSHPSHHRRRPRDWHPARLA